MEKAQNFATAIKQLRKSKGLTLDQISDSCKIKNNYLEKMERGDFSFKSEIYVKLFLNEYLKYIDLNKSESIMQEFNNIFNTKPLDVDLTFMPPDSDQNNNQSDSTFEPHDYDPKQIAIIILIVIIIISVYLSISSFLV